MRRMHRVILGGGMQLFGAAVGVMFTIAVPFVVSFALDGELAGMPLFTSLGAVVLALGISVTLMLTGERVYRKALMNCCPRCEYDLSGQVEPGCPECGWGRTFC